jgi:hypothetical protein
MERSKEVTKPTQHGQHSNPVSSKYNLCCQSKLVQYWHVIATNSWLENFNENINFICFEYTNTVKPLSNVPKFKVFLYLRLNFNDSKKINPLLNVVQSSVLKPVPSRETINEDFTEYFFFILWINQNYMHLIIFATVYTHRCQTLSLVCKLIKQALFINNHLSSIPVASFLWMACSWNNRSKMN